MQIGNGRFFGNLWGNHKHHDISKGESTVDLAIVPHTLFDYVKDFKVLPQKEFSDHCRRGAVVKGVEHISTIVLINI